MASVRCIPVPEFAAVVLRRRMALVRARPGRPNDLRQPQRRPLSPYNVRRTFRDFLKLAGLADTAISLRWYRRTGATVIARGMGTDAAAVFLGHTSSAITEGHYIEPDRSVDRTPRCRISTERCPARPARRLATLPCR